MLTSENGCLVFVAQFPFPPLSPYHEFVANNDAVQAYLLRDPYEITSLTGLHEPYSQNVDYQLRQAIANRRPAWHWLDQAVYSFLRHSQPAARHQIPCLLEAIEATLLTNEWYELMIHYQAVCQHTRQRMSIQHFPKPKEGSQ